MSRDGWRSGLFFALVGSGAAITHLAVFALLEHQIWPELANALGFGVAFAVSFVGHRWLSFAGTRTPLWQSLQRYAITALAGFAFNELCFVLLYRWWGWPSLWALLLAMGLAAVQTFLLSRFWAFMR